MRDWIGRVALGLGSLGFLLAMHAGAAVTAPTVSGPVTGPGGPFVASTNFDVGTVGYVEEEFFVEGSANAFTSAAPLTTDGHWTVTPSGARAAYKTRILVRRPADAKQFNGTVVVEWLNVSGGLDAAPDWIFAHTALMRDGYAWVGVSAQSVGVEGGSNPLGLQLWLKAINPARYGTLSHPGDSFSYDIFSQVGQAVRRPAGRARPLGDLVVRRVLGVGESQSAFRLVTYVDAIHPLAQVYDGFLIHSRGGAGAALAQTPLTPVPVPGPTLIRTDLDAPVLTFETETDLLALGFLAARQPDTRRLRTWEVAGTAHGDIYQLDIGPPDVGPGAIETMYLPPRSSLVGGIINCAKAVNAGPHHYVLSAAIEALDRWVRGGRPPRHAPPLEIAAGPPAAFVLDEVGNVRGGIRTHQVDVPVSVLSGLGQTGSAFCGLFGTTTALDATTLATRYPSHAQFVRKIQRAVRKARHAGFILPVDARAIIAAAVASDIGG